MSTAKTEETGTKPEEPTKALTRVFGFVDGFNLYHALNKLDRAATAAEETKYHKYKWLCLKTLISQYLRPGEDILAALNTSRPTPTGRAARRRSDDMKAT